MPKVAVVNLKREKVGEIELSEAAFGGEVNESLLYEVVKAQLASRRAGSASTKNRAAVAGSTRKLYKQKGTGRARHGSIRAPIYVGGGKAHGPLPRDYSYRPTRKMRLGALRSALSLRLQQGQLLVVDDWALSEVKTKALVSTLEALQVKKSSVLVDSKSNDNLRLSTRNLPKHDFLPPEGVNVYDLLKHEFVILSRSAVEAIEKRFSGNEE